MKKKKNSLGMYNKIKDGKIIIYTDDKGDTELRADIEKNTIWATQNQISRLFEVDVRTVNEHLKNIYKTEELKEISTIRKFQIVQNEGGRKVKRDTNFYNLDSIIAVGYRINSKKATQFRIWSTSILREYIEKRLSIQKPKEMESQEVLVGLQEVMTLLTTTKHHGKLKGKVTLKITKNLESKNK